MQPNYLATENDRSTLVAGIRLARKLAATRALAPYVRGEYRPGPAAQSDDELLEFAKNTGGTIFHPSGTCKMGDIRSDSTAVVDSELRVHAVSALRVVDCSVMPTLVSGNTNVPVVMIAEKAADHILAAAATERH
jgi:choline dehydrogenase